MQAISRVITRVHFKDYNIPESFGEEAQIIILPVEKSSPKIESESYQMMKLQEKSGFNQMLREPEEEYMLMGMTDFFETNDDKNINWEEYFGTK